ncbi:MAG: hypothetical protein Q9169_002862 [Polycauliona sp. 2 TL-2023]
MVELEKRLERKDKCQGFETLFVGIILLNCIERICWALRKAGLEEKGAAQDWPLEGRSIDSYIDQAAHFSEFLSKLFQMRGILADVRRTDSEDGILQGGPRNALIVDQWLSEMQFTSENGLATVTTPEDSPKASALSARVPSASLVYRHSFLRIKEVQIIQWFVEPEARVEQFDKLCEVQSDKAAVDITSRFDGVIKKLHYEPDSMAQVGQPLCDIDVLSEIEPEDEAALASTNEQAGSPSTPQQPQKAAEHEQGQSNEASKEPEVSKAPSTRGHSSLATPAVRGLLKDLKIDISEVTGTGKDGRVLKEDVQNHATSSSSKPAPSPSLIPSKSGSDSTQTESIIPLTPIQSQMFKTMTRSLTIPHFGYSDELNITALSSMRHQLNTQSSSADQPKLSYLPFFIKALSLALDSYPLLNARVDTDTDPSRPRLIMRSAHNIGLAMDTPQGLIVPNIKNVNTLSIIAIASEIQRLRTLALASKLTPTDLTGGTITISNIGSIGGTVVSPILVSSEVAILGMGRKRDVVAFDEEGKVVKREVMNLSWSADHRVVDGATVARCAEVVRGFVERPESMVVKMR